MTVLGNNTEIAAGDTTPDPADHTDFGSARISGGQITHTFTISNSGTSDLTLTDAPLISITGPAALDFNLVVSPTTPVGPNLTTTFDVRFVPTVAGTRVATVTIANNDGDENPYDFAIQGTGTILLVISEIMVNPNSTEPNWEWVEVYNAGSTAIDLTGFILDDNDIPAVTAANITAGSIAPGQTAILYNADSVSAANFQAAWGNNLNLVAVTSWPALANAGDRLGLWDSFSGYGGGYANAVEDITYGNGGGWPTDNNAASIALTNLSADNSVGANWALSTVGGTTPTGVGYLSQNSGGNSGSDIGSPGTPFPTVQFTQAIYQVNEDGTVVGATVTLTRTGLIDGESQVQVNFTNDTAVGGGTDYTSTPTDITFPAGDPGSQTVTVPITQDFIDETTESLTMTVVSVSNAQIGSQAAATLEIMDDDDAGFSLDPASLTISEPDTTGVFTISLDSQPTDSVTVTLMVSDLSECTLSRSWVELTTQNWSDGVTVTVTALDDQEADGAKSCNVVTNAAASNDPNYAGQNPADVAVTINDDDVPGIQVNPTTLAVAEPAGTAVFTVSLTTQPTDSADVTVPLSSGAACAVPTGVTIPNADWNSGVPVTVTAVNDDIDNRPDRTCTVVTGNPSSPAAEYNDLTEGDVADVNVAVTDDDTAGFTISEISGDTSEDGDTATFTVRLNSEPTGDVVINVTSSNPGEGTVSSSPLTFTPLNWSDVQTVTVTGVDDGGNADGNVTYTIGLTIANANTADPTYATLDPEDVAIVNRDNDALPIYLPLILSSFVAAPDLVIDSLTTGSGGPQMTIRNAGTETSSAAFWVDVYFNPTPTPPPLNRTWQSIAPAGAAWGVTQSLAPGETLTLIVGGPYYAGGSSSFPAGAQVYVYVDSINYATTYGNVRENSETQ